MYRRFPLRSLCVSVGPSLDEWRSAGPDESSEFCACSFTACWGYRLYEALSLAGSVIITLRRLRLGLLVMRTGLRIEAWAAREGKIEVLDVGIHFNLPYRQLLCNNDTVLFMRAAP
jgi:hypothetical protein